MEYSHASKESPLLLTYHVDLYDTPKAFAEEVIEEEELPVQCVAEIACLVTEKLEQQTKQGSPSLSANVYAEDRAALADMQLHKFYPHNPGLDLGLPFVNRYFGNANQTH